MRHGTLALTARACQEKNKKKEEKRLYRVFSGERRVCFCRAVFQATRDSGSASWPCPSGPVEKGTQQPRHNCPCSISCRRCPVGADPHHHTAPRRDLGDIHHAHATAIRRQAGKPKPPRERQMRCPTRTALGSETACRRYPAHDRRLSSMSHATGLLCGLCGYHGNARPGRQVAFPSSVLAEDGGVEHHRGGGWGSRFGTPSAGPAAAAVACVAG